MKAAAYIRVSTADQAQHGVSLDAQESRIRAYALAIGLDLVAVIREEGVSAGKPLSTRPGGQELLSLIASGAAQHVVALKLDRIFRDAAEALTQTKAWDNAGLSLHLVDMGGQALNTGSAMGRMFLTMTAAFAELERNLISERTRTALQYKKAQGAILGRPRLGAEADEAGLVVRIVALHEEALSLRRIAATLDAEGFKTQKGGKWSAQMVNKILARQGVA